MSKFQIITFVLFIIFIISGVIAFALYKGSDSTASFPPITIWGTFPEVTFNQYVNKINNGLQQTMRINYVYVSPSSFSREFVSALAKGQGPDAILITSDMILPHEDKLALIPFTALSQRAIQDSFIQESSLYLANEGILALPFSVDPLIMYWNRDMFNGAGIATYPRYWDEFTTINKKLTVKDQNGNVRKSAIAMGDFTNINNVRELFGTLLMQLGNKVTTQTSDGVRSTIKASATPSPVPAIQFFTQFTNPASDNYSWNRSLPESKSSFLAGTLATYFGFASELADIRTKNPNLNFDAALIPQVRTGGKNATYGNMYGLSLVRSSSNLSTAFQIISTLTQPQYLADLSDSMYLPSVRTDVIARGTKDAYISIFNNAALVASSWLDADPTQSRQIFGNMIQSYTSGQQTIYQATQDAGDQYDILLEQATQ